MPVLILRISRWLALGLVLASLLLPWFHVPNGLREVSHSVYRATFEQPHVTIVFKLLIVATLLVSALIGFRRNRSQSGGFRLPMTVAGSFLLVVIGIMFPAYVTQRSSAVSAHASWLNLESASLIDSTGDIFTASEYAFRPNQPVIEIQEVLPRSFDAVPTPAGDGFLGLHLTRFNNILGWLGYTDAYCDFAHWGWFLAVAGSLLLVLTHLRPRGEKDVTAHQTRRIYRTIAVLPTVAFLVCLLCLLPVVMASQELSSARSCALDGSYEQALRHLALARNWMPVLGYGSDMLFQCGWVERNLGRDTPQARLASAIQEEERGFYERASSQYFALLNADPSGPVADEAFRGALRIAIKDFNSTRFDRARGSLLRLAAFRPASLKVSYGLQLIDLRDLRKDDLECEVSKFVVVYNCLQNLKKNAVFGQAHRRLADLEYDYRDMDRLGEEMRLAIKPKD
jgi:hypothetical protein